jgi:hypothetical protein
LKEEGRREGEEEQWINKVSGGEVGEGRKEAEYDTNARTHSPDGKESRSEDEWLVQIQETDTQFLRWTKAPW